MRTRITEYEILDNRRVQIDPSITVEDVRLIINETKKIVIASSMQKDNISINNGIVEYTENLPISEVGDIFTIEIDKGDTISSELDAMLKRYDNNIASQLESIIG